MRNVELKVKIKDIKEINNVLENMKLGEAVLINQHDIFYNVQNGRLKLRKFEDHSGELIYYERSDSEGPKLSSYEKATLPPDCMENVSKVLSRSLGLKGEVKKQRRLFMLGQTRIHIDCVEGLGDYMELEVVLRPEQSVEEGQEIAESIIKQFNIHKEDLIPVAYMDLLLKN